MLYNGNTTVCRVMYVCKLNYIIYPTRIAFVLCAGFIHHESNTYETFHPPKKTIIVFFFNCSMVQLSRLFFLVNLTNM